nr:alanine racemase [uncultured Acetatifactor sp.]
MRTKANYGCLDRFRIAAALLVIAIHTSPLTSFHEGADFFLTRVLARVAVPFFFMVTGQFVAAGFLPSGEASASPKGMNRFRKYLVKTSLLYLFCIILYLPIGIYAGHYKDLTVGAALRMLFFDGTFYHLWYFPACISGILLVYLMSRFLSLRGMTIVSAVLYVIGLFGDSYYGLAAKAPAVEAVYGFLFQISSYTRNGLFLAPLFLVLGAWMAEAGQKRNDGADSERLLFFCSLFALSFALMTGEAFLLRHFELQRHDSMYLMLIPVMFFLYRILQSIPKKSSGIFRAAATWIYMLHPAFIVVVRGIARPLRLTELLVDNSFVHYLAVAALSVIAGFAMAWLQERRQSGRRGSHEAGSRTVPAARGRKQAISAASGDAWGGDDVISSENEFYSDSAEFDDSYSDASNEEDWDSLYPEEVMAEEETDNAYPDNSYPESFPEEARSEEPYQEEPYGGEDSEESHPEAAYGEQARSAPSAQSPAFSHEKSPASRAWIEVDSRALAHNVEALRSRLPERCRLMPAVKADGYGHGAVLISRQLNLLGVDAFCVACVEEAIELREAGIQGEILILGYTPPEDFPLLVRYRLIQTVIDYPYARQLNQAEADIHVHIGIDTGMHRLGIRCEDIEEITAVCELQHIVIDGLFTHLCASDSPLPEHRAFTEAQVSAFYQVVDYLKAEGYPCPSLHLLASYGLLTLLQGRGNPSGNQSLRFAERRVAAKELKLAADYVRPGIALYGLLSSEADTLPWKGILEPVLSLKAKVTSLRPLYAGEAAGYGAAFTARQDMRIAAISIGYADGLPRELSYGKGSVLIRGSKAPIIGRICMDQSIVDVSGIPHIQPGDTAVIIGVSGEEEITAGQIAEQCGTISNEILSRLGARLDRVLL